MATMAAHAPAVEVILLRRHLTVTKSVALPPTMHLTLYESPFVLCNLPRSCFLKNWQLRVCFCWVLLYPWNSLSNSMLIAIFHRSPCGDWINFLYVD
jgi:hypothetical protein